MRTIITTLLLLVLSIAVRAQAPEGLSQDAHGRYRYVHTVSVPEATKDILYERLKSFVVSDLNASDTYINWDETAHDSITTVAFFEFENTPEMHNQVVDCRAKLEFSNGTAVLKLWGFNYSAIATYGDQSFSTPLYRMKGVPDAAQSWIRAGVEQSLLQLAARMDALANEQQPMAAKRATQRRKSKRHA